MTEAERRQFEEVQAIGYRPLVRGALWGAGGVVVGAVLLYSAFWLPYRNPGEDPPHPIPILPPPAPRPPTTVNPPTQDYEWVDREAGIVRIPIEDAMTIISERLPVRENANDSPQAADQKPPATDAGSGRTPRRGGK